MKIKTTLLLVAVINTATGAGAWSHSHCKLAEPFASQRQIARNCSKFIAGKGVISSGKYEGCTWETIYPKADFADIRDRNVYLEHNGNKYQWKINGHQDVRSKHLNKADALRTYRDIGESPVYFYHTITNETESEQS